jgi:hypothetical protein
MTTDNFCFYLQNGLIQTSQTVGQLYSGTSPFSIPLLILCIVALHKEPRQVVPFTMCTLYDND